MMRPARAQLIDRSLLGASVLTLFAAGIMWAAEARADVVDDYTAVNAPAVCMAIIDDGLAPEAAGRVIARSVILHCPEHPPEMQFSSSKWSKRVMA